VKSKEKEEIFNPSLRKEAKDSFQISETKAKEMKYLIKEQEVDIQNLHTLLAYERIHRKKIARITFWLGLLFGIIMGIIVTIILGGIM